MGKPTAKFRVEQLSSALGENRRAGSQGSEPASLSDFAENLIVGLLFANTIISFSLLNVV